MIVELIGPPGAGKTTLLPTVIERLKQQDLRAFTAVEAARPLAQKTMTGKLVQSIAPPRLVRPLLWQTFFRLSILHRVKFMALHPALIWHVANSQRRRPPGADVRRRKVWRWFARHAGYYQFFKTHAQPDEVVVFDEGFLHRVVQLFCSSEEKPNAQQVADYVERLPAPDLTVFIQASPSVCARRVHLRGVWERLRDWREEEISQFVANAHWGVNLAVEHARRAGWHVVEINNDSNDIRVAQAAVRREISFNPAVTPPAVTPEAV